MGNMAEDDFPTEYDVIVVGTGMTESIVAAAASRIGKTVLHLDSNDYYGGQWASFNFENFQKWLSNQMESNGNNCSIDLTECLNLLEKDEVFQAAGCNLAAISNVVAKWFIEKGPRRDSVEQWSCKSQTIPSEYSNQHSAESPDEIAIEAAEEEQSSKSSEKIAYSGIKISAQPTTTGIWTQDDIESEYRKFNLDLAPKLLFARGALVELLISSNISRYAEFRAATRVLTWLDGRLKPVPCSRADVFATKDVSVVEKRMLMKLLTNCMDADSMQEENEKFRNKTFKDYLQSKKVTPHLVHFVLYGIAMAKDNTPYAEGVQRTQRFLGSLGRYGNTPFLWAMYGSGEIPQSFCRLCAVFGGVYYLHRPVEALIIKTSTDESGEKANSCVGVLSNRQRLSASKVVVGVGHAPPPFITTSSAKGLSRGIFFTNRSILPAMKEPLTLLQFPPSSKNPEPITIIEVGPSTHACPRGLYVVHMTTRQRSTAFEDLQEAVESLLNTKQVVIGNSETSCQSTQTPTGSGNIRQDTTGSDAGIDVAEAAVPTQNNETRPQVLWCLYFNSVDSTECTLTEEAPENVYLCGGPDVELDFDFAVNQAKAIFTRMYPDTEFLPRAPDPEDIVLEGEETGPVFGEGEQANHETDSVAERTGDSNEAADTDVVEDLPQKDKNAEDEKSVNE